MRKVIVGLLAVLFAVGFVGGDWGVAHGQTAGPVPTVVPGVTVEPTEQPRSTVLSTGGENSENTPSLLGNTGEGNDNLLIAFAAILLVTLGFILWNLHSYNNED